MKTPLDKSKYRFLTIDLIDDNNIEKWPTEQKAIDWILGESEDSDDNEEHEFIVIKIIGRVKLKHPIPKNRFMYVKEK